MPTKKLGEIPHFIFIPLEILVFHRRVEVQVTVVLNCNSKSSVLLVWTNMPNFLIIFDFFFFLFALLCIWEAGKVCRYMVRSDSDKDLGGDNFMDQHVASTDGFHIVLINNLETNLSPIIIEQFIHRHTSILPKVLVFPRQSPFPYANGAICLGSETKLEKIFRFLTNPDHMIISARGRYQLSSSSSSYVQWSHWVWEILTNVNYCLNIA